MNIEEIYIIISDFIKALKQEPVWKKIESVVIGTRGPKAKLSLDEAVTLNIMRFYYRTVDMKSFHRLVKEKFSSEFPNLPNYENFMRSSRKTFPIALCFLQYLLYLGRLQAKSGVHYVDSTSIKVCKNHNIPSHKVAKGVAKRGKTTIGWFFGFKLHGIYNDEGFLEEIIFSSGNEHDNQFLESLTERVNGAVVCDAGYLVKEEVFKRIFDKVGQLLIAPRKNMKKAMTGDQAILFCRRSQIETAWGILKERFQLATNLARNISGYFRHYVYAITAWCLERLIARKVIEVAL